MNHLNIETTDLLLLPDFVNKKEKLLYKCHYDISPYWKNDSFNKYILHLKDRYDKMNPIYLGVDKLWGNRDLSEVLKELADIINDD